MKTSAKLSRIAAAVALSVGLSTTAMAQVTSSELNGQILAPNGSPAVGTVIKVTHVPTGAVKTVTVNNGGTFSLRVFALVVHTLSKSILMNTPIKQSATYT